MERTRADACRGKLHSWCRSYQRIQGVDQAFHRVNGNGTALGVVSDFYSDHQRLESPGCGFPPWVMHCCPVLRYGFFFVPGCAPLLPYILVAASGPIIQVLLFGAVPKTINPK